MALIRTITDLKKYGVPNASMSIISISPYLYQAEQDHIIPLIGDGLYNALNTALDTTPSPTQAALIEKLRYAIAPLALYYFTGENELNIGDVGITRNETESGTKTAYNSQIVRTRKNLYTRGMASLDKALSSLQEKKADFEQWANSDAYSAYNELLLRSGIEFAKYYRSLKYPAIFYSAAAHLIKMVEDLHVIPALGSTFTAIKTKRKNNATLSVDEKVLVDTVGTAIAYFTISMAITELQVRLDDSGLSVLTNPVDNDQDDTSKRTAASASQVSSLQMQSDSIAKEYLDATIDYLNKKASAEIFPDWYAQQAQTNTNTTTTDINQTLNGLYSM